MTTKKTNQKKAKEAYISALQLMKMDVQEEISLCLSDLPRTHMSKSSNGKIYINLTVAMRKEPDQWGRDLKVYVTPTKEDRTNHANKIYVGGGKLFIFAEQSQEVAPSQEEINNIIPTENDDKEESPLPY